MPAQVGGDPSGWKGFTPPLHEGHLSKRACCVVNIIVIFMLIFVLSSS